MCFDNAIAMFARIQVTTRWNRKALNPWTSGRRKACGTDGKDLGVHPIRYVFYTIVFNVREGEFRLGTDEGCRRRLPTFVRFCFRRVVRHSVSTCSPSFVKRVRSLNALNARVFFFFPSTPVSTTTVVLQTCGTVNIKNMSHSHSLILGISAPHLQYCREREKKRSKWMKNRFKIRCYQRFAHGQIPVWKLYVRNEFLLVIKNNRT